jgi:short subunit fatty acids transporter
VATAPPVYAMIRALAKVPTTGPGAAAYVGLFSMLASLVSWSFSLIFSGLLAREVTNRVKGATTAPWAPPPIWAWAACGRSACRRRLR